MTILKNLLTFLILAEALSANFILAAEKIDINTAPLEDLVQIIHIGETRASELISLRPFSSLDELTDIKGIGEARLNDIKKQGLAWVATENSKPTKGEPPPVFSEDRPLKLITNEAAETGSPQTLGSPQALIEPERNGPGTVPIILAAVFTSFSGGVTILLLKKKLKLS